MTGAHTGGGAVRIRPTAPWQADPYTEALRAGRGPLFLRRSDGRLLPLEVERWCAAPDAADLTVLERCRGAVLDIGCGPGRIVTALTARRGTVLGIDVSPAAVARTVHTGGSAMVGSVFEPLPHEGSWDTGLLLDGNIGIGGDPKALLTRATQILGPSASLIVETALSDGAGAEDLDEQFQAQLDNGTGASGPVFTWARLGAEALVRYSRTTCWTPTEQWTAGGRSFVALRRQKRNLPNLP
ncbi:methyltransferase domain-containing protein [Streptomyces sp. NPDC059092]|uniref:methyltransferase domain-containing protein n=1 Tax=Streptomyces sp. NPDC059092 TaxID=3346725 RepID=UPI0036B584C6